MSVSYLSVSISYLMYSFRTFCQIYPCSCRHARVAENPGPKNPQIIAYEYSRCRKPHQRSGNAHKASDVAATEL